MEMLFHICKNHLWLQKIIKNLIGFKLLLQMSYEVLS